MTEQVRKRLRRAFLWGLALGSCVGAAYLLGFFDALELKALNARFLLRGVQAPASPIVIVAIDDNSFQELYERGAQWPWPRAWHAELIERLSHGSPLIIGLDLLFTEPSRFGPDDDRAFARAIRKAGNVVLAAHFSQEKIVLETSEGETTIIIRRVLNLPLPRLRDPATGYGSVNIPPDVDAFIRRAPIVQRYQGRLEPSFARHLWELASGVRDKGSPGGPILINFRGPAGTSVSTKAPASSVTV